MEDLPVTFDEGMLDVGDGHSIYWRAQGPRDAPAMLVVHGGPGGAMNVKWAEVLDQDAWRVVFFDQRGCGKSKPFGKLEHNGLDALVGDMEKLRAALGIERWAIFGGSWGTTLGLAYGVAHPERCTGFLLRGVFLARREDIDWFLWDVRRVFPDAHGAFLDAIEAACGQRPANAQDILTLTEAPLARFDEAGARLARAWTLYETTLSVVNKPASEPADEDKRPSAEANAAAVSMALLERHYMAQELPPEALLPRVARIAHLPCRIVHGRFDMVCPADQAVALAAHWPGAGLAVVSGAGHWTFEPGNVVALRAGAQALADAIRNA
ncbi:prolyl aminopeptidase [Caballeronia sp. LZ062]|uniref:prolyl aminopeptidase n=1 Tax=unclassified Caballeronia TaxID=2646786 RepID=UPI0028677291|nr:MULTISPECIES: prolyl aminopeptidase [unclassified Caballeronia]MDR5856789.1 prolyl aminopeptidase [Caballeronia sp. LZ050]MDR5869814.1 prolyl aminopeptidase [Caballeronia sp. LZ062]